MANSAMPRISEYKVDSDGSNLFPEVNAILKPSFIGLLL